MLPRQTAVDLLVSQATGSCTVSSLDRGQDGKPAEILGSALRLEVRDHAALVERLLASPAGC